MLRKQWKPFSTFVRNAYLRSQGGRARRHFPPRQNLNVSIDYQLKLSYFVFVLMPKNPSTGLIIVIKTWIDDRLPVLFSSGGWHKQYKPSPFADKSAPTLVYFVSMIIKANLSRALGKTSVGNHRTEKSLFICQRKGRENTSADLYFQKMFSLCAMYMTLICNHYLLMSTHNLCHFPVAIFSKFRDSAITMQTARHRRYSSSFYMPCYRLVLEKNLVMSQVSLICIHKNKIKTY